MTRSLARSVTIALLLSLALTGPAAAPEARADAPAGTMTWGLHVTLVSKWLDPADTEAFINPFMVLYAVHDALVKPMPAGDNTPSPAQAWTTSKDRLTHEVVLRKKAKVHNRDPVTADHLKFSLHR